MLQVVSVRYRYRSYVDPDVEQLQMEIWGLAKERTFTRCTRIQYGPYLIHIHRPYFHVFSLPAGTSATRVTHHYVRIDSTDRQKCWKDCALGQTILKRIHIGKLNSHVWMRSIFSIVGGR
jgi:hypothetical protein